MELNNAVIYKKGKVYEIKIADKYAYIQECADEDENMSSSWQASFKATYGEEYTEFLERLEAIKRKHNFKSAKKIYYEIIYEKCFDSPINDISELDSSGYFVVNRCEPVWDIYTLLLMTVDERSVYADLKRTYARHKISIKLLGEFPIRHYIEIPSFQRALEINGPTYEWILKDVHCEVNAKTYKKANKIMNLPPYFPCFTQVIDWWEHELTLETFDDNYAKLRVDEIYPEFKDKVKLPIAEVLENHKNNFFNTDLDADLDISTKTGYNEIDLALKKFMRQPPKTIMNVPN
jgi:hypothetical protein